MSVCARSPVVACGHTLRMKADTDFLTHVLRGDVDAVDFAFSLIELAHLWDDLVDGDLPCGPEDINQAMQSALTLHRHVFYRKHADVLWPVMHSALFAWYDANLLERGSRHDRTIAFGLREAFIEPILTMAAILGGDAWRQQVGPSVRRYNFDESLDAYLTELDERLGGSV